MSRCAALVCGCCLLVFAGASEVAVSPVQKVIELLQHMVEKGTEDSQAEQVQFTKFKGFCTSTIRQKQAAIEDADDQIEMLTADIEKFRAEAFELAKEIAQQDADIATWTGDSQAATKVREIENNDYIATTENLKAGIQAVDDGIAYIAAQQKDVPQKAAAVLAQLKYKSRLSDAENRVIKLLLDKGVPDENLAASAPEARAYESQTSGVTDVLSGIGGKFDKEKTDIHEVEAEAKHHFTILIQDLRRQIDSATQSRTENAKAKANALQKGADAKSQLADTTGTRDADSKYLQELTATCEKKSADFANRQKLMQEEQVAINKAIEIMAGSSVSKTSLLRLQMHIDSKPFPSLMQLRSGSQSPTQLKVAAYLKTQALKIDSRILSALAMRVSADPLKKVKKMIKDLVVKLMEEAEAETEHKGWCDTELSTNEQTRHEKTENVELLTAEIDELKASVSSLTDQISELSKAVTELDEQMLKVSTQRSEEKETNTQVIKEAQQAQAAVDRAVGVLNDFYAKAAEATSFAQTSHKALHRQNPESPEIFSDEPYTGMGAENGGVIGMMEVISTDFARLETDTSAAESAAADEYKALMHDSTVEKASKAADLQHRESTKQNHEQALQEKKHDLAGNTKELQAANMYYDKLKPSCIETGVSYEERVARRKEEIESLKTALRVLNNEDVA